MKVRACKRQALTPKNENAKYDEMWKCDHPKHARWTNIIEAELDDTE